MEEIHLPAPSQFPEDGVIYHALVVFQHIGLHWVPVVRGFFNYRHVPYAGKGHVQGAGDGRGGKGEHVGRLAQGFQLFLLGHPKALFLVDDDKAQVFKAHILAHQAVGAHNHVHAAPFHPAQDFLLLLWRAEAGQQLHVYRETLHAP